MLLNLLQNVQWIVSYQANAHWPMLSTDRVLLHSMVMSSWRNFLSPKDVQSMPTVVLRFLPSFGLQDYRYVTMQSFRRDRNAFLSVAVLGRELKCGSAETTDTQETHNLYNPSPV